MPGRCFQCEYFTSSAASVEMGPGMVRLRQQGVDWRICNARHLLLPKSGFEEVAGRAGDGSHVDSTLCAAGGFLGHHCRGAIPCCRHRGAEVRLGRHRTPRRKHGEEGRWTRGDRPARRHGARPGPLAASRYQCGAMLQVALALQDYASPLDNVGTAVQIRIVTVGHNTGTGHVLPSAYLLAQHQRARQSLVS